MNETCMGALGSSGIFRALITRCYWLIGLYHPGHTKSYNRVNTSGLGLLNLFQAEREPAAILSNTTQTTRTSGSGIGGILGGIGSIIGGAALIPGI